MRFKIIKRELIKNYVTIDTIAFKKKKRKKSYVSFTFNIIINYVGTFNVILFILVMKEGRKNPNNLHLAVFAFFCYYSLLCCQTEKKKKTRNGRELKILVKPYVLKKGKSRCFST